MPRGASKALSMKGLPVKAAKCSGHHSRGPRKPMAGEYVHMGAPSFVQAVSIAMTGLPSRSGAASMKRPRNTSTMRWLER
eukprot:958667-Pleurochrysis_carterae.AAC.1